MPPQRRTLPGGVQPESPGNSGLFLLLESLRGDLRGCSWTPRTHWIPAPLNSTLRVPKKHMKNLQIPVYPPSNESINHRFFPAFVREKSFLSFFFKSCSEHLIGSHKVGVDLIPSLFFLQIYLSLPEGQLLYDIVLVFAIHQHESAIANPISWISVRTMPLWWCLCRFGLL